RFRPILMTAFAFILGVVPLMRASGAGAGAQNVMGTGVFWGMLVATFMGVFIIPGNYTFIEGLGRRRKKHEEEAPPGDAEQPPSVVDHDSPAHGSEQHPTAGEPIKAKQAAAGTKDKVDGVSPKTSDSNAIKGNGEAERPAIKPVDDV